MTVELKSYSDDELRAIPPLKVGYNHLRNPFHRFTDPLGVKLANRWAWIHWPDDMARENGQDASGEVDSFDALEHSLALKKSGFHRAEGPQGFALFPSVAKDVGAWEWSCQNMHEAQTPVTLADKPSDKNYRPTRLVGDLDDHSAPPLFEDSEESRRMRGLSRGD